MADVKISGLPASTTPLAGTEVLPVVQGGVTKQVSVANLTAGRAVSAASLALTGTALPVGSGGTGLSAVTAGYIPFGGTATALATSVDGFVFDPINVRLGIFTTAPAEILDAHGTIRASRRGATSQFVNLLAAAGGSFLNVSSGSGALSISTNGGTTSMLSIDSSGNTTVGAGNLVIGTSGKGIDFSATPNTGTSELLADYEEGTWTPVFASAAGTITSTTVNAAKYTKVGRLVTLSFDVTITNNGTGAVAINVTGLPYAAAAAYSSAGTLVEVAAVGFGGFVNQNSTTALSLVTATWTYPGGTNYRIIGSVAYNV